MTPDELHALVDRSPLWAIGAVIGIGFTAIYLGYAGLSLVVTRRLLPHLGIGALIESRALNDGQIRSEILNSLVSIAIFAGYGMLTVLAERRGVVDINWDPGGLTVLFNLALLTLWNEVHFYACHRTLHTRWLYRKVHAVHHRSVVPTPFTTFSFHWVEATMLSSVMILLLLVWPLDIYTVMLFPGVSLFINSIGHMNYAVFPDKDHGELLAACQLHTAHHTRWSGNYAFYLPWLDRWLGTRLPLRRTGKG
jgi:sterol desaturase/sphingolipid hydroxylase (fatty acid hydroxylase superfamily)